MKIKGLGIPYMGSKRQIAPKIVDYILAKNPNVKYVYDLFGETWYNVTVMSL